MASRTHTSSGFAFIGATAIFGSAPLIRAAVLLRAAVIRSAVIWVPVVGPVVV